jgi:hypothetical protein
MARRAGKAASRKARQRSPQRASRPAPPPPSPASSASSASPVAEPAAISTEPPRRASTPSLRSGASTLTTRERAEYHYVERDLRNIGILTAAMAALLLLAWIVFSALNLTG